MAGSDNAGVKVTMVGMTDVGRVREHNEDAFLVLPTPEGTPTENGQRVEVDLATATVFAVCDGMGGAAAGEVASRMAAEKLASVLGEADYDGATPDQVASLMDRAVQDANDEILTEARENVERKGMGTTLTAAVAVPGRVFISQVGDSRGYLLRKGKLFQLTKDQSLIAQLIEEGTLTEEEAEKLGGRNIVLQAVGVEDSLRVDTKHWEVLRGDLIVLCSDGLTGMIDDERVESILNECGDDLRMAVDQLIDAANDGGGRDNITVVLAKFDGEGLRPPMEALSPGAEKAGAGFAAPPPPEVPNPMKKVGGVLLAIIAVLALIMLNLPSTADLVVTWSPANVEATVTVTGGAAETPLEATGTGSARIVDVEPGDYKIKVEAPKYYAAEQDLRNVKTGEVPAQLTLGPRPGTVRVRVNTPHVRIIVEATGDGSAEALFTRDPEWRDPAEELVLDGIVPAGPVTVRVTADGFADFTETQTLGAQGDIAFDVAALTAKTATLVVTVDPPEAGFVVQVHSSTGEKLAGPMTTGADGRVELEVRQGLEHTVRASKEGFGESESRVSVGAEGAEVRVKAAVQKVKVSITGTPGTLFKLQRNEGGTWTDVGILRRIEESGPNRGKYNRILNLEPGDYRLTWNDGGGQKAFSVKAGDPPTPVALQD